MLKWLKNNRIWVFLGGILLVALLGAALRAPSVLPAGAFQLPADPVEFAPEPEPLESPAPAKAPEGAVTVSVGGQRLFTLESEETAAAFLNGLLQQAYEAADSALYPGAAFLGEVTLQMPQPGETVLPLEQAQALLLADPGLIPIAVSTTAAEIQFTDYERKTEKSALLPLGSRMIATLGREGASVTLRTTTAITGEAAATTASGPEQVLWQPITETLLSGKYRSSSPTKEPGKGEGEKGPKDVELTLKRPVRADISSNFGTRIGAMHYGVDYACKAGTEVTAPVSGKVIYAAERGEYGTVLEIETSEGFVLRLARITALTVKRGDIVESGQAVAQVAKTQEEEGKPHVHMELLYGGVAYNPRQYLK